jgi:SAM-dependent methyltransferase
MFYGKGPNMDYLEINRSSWDKRAKTHLTSDFYDVEGFLSGATALKDIELVALGDVKGQKLLHLQCHFGLDTLSWARLGAQVTGVDFSPSAISQAKDIAEKAQLKGDFICADIYEFGTVVRAEFDICFTSYGAVCWLPDLKKWAKTVAASLKKGGTFYMAEFHPIYDLITGDRYFYEKEPEPIEEGTYTENAGDEKSSFMIWSHPLSDVINALIGAGICIEEVKEYPYSPHYCFADLTEREEGKFYMTKDGNDVPLIYSIKGSKI